MAKVFGMLRAQSFWDENINRLADKLIVRVTKHPFELAVGEDYLSKALNKNYSEGTHRYRAAQDIFGYHLLSPWRCDCTSVPAHM